MHVLKAAISPLALFKISEDSLRRVACIAGVLQRTGLHIIKDGTVFGCLFYLLCFLNSVGAGRRVGISKNCFFSRPVLVFTQVLCTRLSAVHWFLVPKRFIECYILTLVVFSYAEIFGFGEEWYWWKYSWNSSVYNENFLLAYDPAERVPCASLVLSRVVSCRLVSSRVVSCRPVSSCVSFE